ncbi:MAG: acyl-CoA desaturase [Deltaproteobacteria bacterium]|nr:acyl-CoA desaturase [Deltaproteobacteria bacterium]
MAASSDTAAMEVAKTACDGASAKSADRSLTAIPTLIYVIMQAGTLLVFVVGVSTADVLLCAASFFIRIWAITGVYHRYFSHRTYRTSRVMQFLLAFLGTTAVQKGPLWWASIHRIHHSESDRPDDPHSPRRSFWYAHQGWVFDPRWARTRTELIRDLMKYPELVWLNQWHIVGPITWGVLCFLIGGWSGLVWGFLVSTTITWHATYTINSLAHRIGRKRFDTGDDSKNSLILALLTLGEGWHNNHHYHPSCTRQGFYWWEIDITYYVLRGLQATGLIWDIKEPPARAYRDAATASDEGRRLAA